MKVALVAPPYPLEEIPSPPLGICYAAAACEAAGADVRVFDYIVGCYTPENLKAALDAFQPDIVGATSVTLNFPVAADILKTAKQHRPEAVTMMGGPHVSFDAEAVLRGNPDIDVVFMGEAENSLAQWLPLYADRSAWASVNGISFMDDGAFLTTGFGECVRDLETLPMPARHLLPISKYHALGFPVSIITSRGCPHQCIFCLGRRMVGPRVRFRSAVRVADEIETLLDLGFTRINIADDLFTASKKRVRAFCDEIIRRSLSFTWSAFARVDTVSEEVLRLMRRAGCDAVSFGIESGNPEMLRRIKKGITLDQARHAVSLCKNVGILPHASFMVGLPGETVETMQDSLAFAAELDIAHGYHFLAPFPGTAIREHVDDYDLEILTDDWTRYDANRAIVRTAALAPEEMNAFVDEAYRPIYEEFEALKRRCREGNGAAEERLQAMASDRLNLVFDILSKNRIESLGVIPGDTHDPVRELVRRIAGAAHHEETFVEHFIRDWMARGYLAFSGDNGWIRWFWTETEFLTARLPYLFHCQTGAGDLTSKKGRVPETISAAESIMEI
jgi:anaerobic magnesium-protoporphyrin IX monomethyl ester cyclase